MMSRPLALVFAAMFLSGCGLGGFFSGETDLHPRGASSSRGAVAGFLKALERRDAAAMRSAMTVEAQRNETDAEGGLLADPPKLTSFRILYVDAEDPGGNASPDGATASLRYTVALTPSAGFDNDDTVGSSFDILVSETADRRWLVAELGGCC